MTLINPICKANEASCPFCRKNILVYSSGPYHKISDYNDIASLPDETKLGLSLNLDMRTLSCPSCGYEFMIDNTFAVPRVLAPNDPRYLNFINMFGG